MKISFISKAIILLVGVSLISHHVSAMDYAKKFTAYLNPKLKQIEEFSQPVLEKIINSPIWVEMCNYLIKLGKEVDSCTEYKKGTVAVPLAISRYQKLDAEAREKLIFITLLQFGFCVLPSLKYVKTTSKDISEYPGMSSRPPSQDPGNINSIKPGSPIESGMTSFSVQNFFYNIGSLNQTDYCELPHQTDIPHSPQSISFSTLKGNSISCNLHPELSLNCCIANGKHCVQFNILDNQGNAVNNCCAADSEGKIKCSELLCSDLNTIRAPCVEGGELINKTLEQTYSQKHHELNDALNEAWDKSSILKHSIQRDERVFERILPSDPIQPIVKHLDQLEKHFNLTPEHSIKYLKKDPRKIRDIYSAYLESGKEYLSLSRHHILPRLDFILAHELAHIYQAYKFQVIKLKILKPGYEISADILGALAADYQSIAAVGAQWLRTDIFLLPSSTVCQHLSVFHKQYPDITRDNAAEVSNLLRTNYILKPHPTNQDRGIILLKLSTMIKAAVQYLESKTS